MLRRASLIATLGFLLAGCGSTTLTRAALTKEVESIGSAAAEGGLLAHDTADGRSTHAFTAVHSKFLVKQVRKVETKLSSADVPPDLEQDRGKADRLAARVESQLERLHDDPADRNVARSVASRLDDAAKQAEELAK